MDKEQALDAALAQIDRAFGKEPQDGPERVNMKVWMDPFTEDRMRFWIMGQVEAWLPDDFDMSEKMWEDIGDRMANGDHRILEYHPFDRMYPPVTLGEVIGLFFRRLFGRFQRSESQKWEAKMARYDPPVTAQPLQATPSLDNPPF